MWLHQYFILMHILDGRFGKQSDHSVPNAQLITVNKQTVGLVSLETITMNLKTCWSSFWQCTNWPVFWENMVRYVIVLSIRSWSDWAERPRFQICLSRASKQNFTLRIYSATSGVKWSLASFWVNSPRTMLLYLNNDSTREPRCITLTLQEENNMQTLSDSRNFA